ncbi:HAD family hydrolase [Streptomyces sp. NPDC048442]|uniref:HAD family hydrolase n=1 Tax=Streptomyces sp. NPDC048442 TaxID=3154823 RepID=UPI0034343D18
MARAALFDVDGTLVDTNHLHVVTWWEALRQAGHHVPTTAIHRAIGLGSDDLLVHLLGEKKGRRAAEAGEVSAAHSTLYGEYRERLTAFEGAGDLLRALDSRGWRIVLVTSASDEELGALRRAIGADEVIRDVASADDVSEGKPAPDPVEHALELVGADAGQSVFVGDSVWDMKAAVRAGVRAVALLSGGIPRADLEEAGAGTVHTDPAALLASLNRDGGPFAEN